MKNPILSLSLLVILTGVCFPVWAEKSDRNKPMNIEADLLRYDDLKQISIFSGAVTLTKGSIQIRGARLEVRQDPEGYQFGIVTVSAETPAFFRQKREGVDEFIEGEGEVETNGVVYSIKPGSMYALNRNDKHYLRAKTTMRLVCVFNPPLKGNESHSLTGQASCY